jgi:multidrug efflux pump subunit AcrB
MEMITDGTAGHHHRQAVVPVSTTRPPGASSFSLQLSGESTERLAVISRDVAHRLASVPGLGLEAVRSEAGTGEEEVQIVVDRDRRVGARS